MVNKILLVTVKKLEAKTVLDIFSKATSTTWKREFIQDKTYYSLGRIRGTDVFMVQSEMGSAGPGAAFQTISKAIHALSPKAIIMVGIAFGVQPQKQKLGDVLVSKQLMAYEAGKVKGEFIPRGDRVTCSPFLLSMFRSGDIDWEGVKVHFGLMLSGDKLVADQSFRDWLLSKEPEAIGGEMEGAGLYVAAQGERVDWIVVKGICDWADGNKDDNAQSLAAKNAVNFVLHVLQQSSNDDKSPSSGELKIDIDRSKNAIEAKFFPAQEADSSHQVFATDKIRELLDRLRDNGEYLVYELPSAIDNNFLIELERLINSLYLEIDRELTSVQSKSREEILEALMKIVGEEILPAVSEWCEFVRQDSHGHRPRELFKNMKSIGKEIRDLHKYT